MQFVNGQHRPRPGSLVRNLVDGLVTTMQRGADAAERLERGEAQPGDEKRVEMACSLCDQLAKFFKPTEGMV